MVASRGREIAAGFHPAVTALFRLEWLAGIGSPAFYHFTSLVLHAIATWLFFHVIRGAGARTGVALGASLLFAAHPIHTEAVAYVSGRPDLLATVCALGALALARSARVCAPGAADRGGSGRRTLCSRWRSSPTRSRWSRRSSSSAWTAGDRRACRPAGAPPCMGIRRGGGRGPSRADRRGGAAPERDTRAARARGRRVGAILAAYETLRALVVPYPLDAMRTLTTAEAASATLRIQAIAAIAALALFVAAAARPGSRGRAPLGAAARPGAPHPALPGGLRRGTSRLFRLGRLLLPRGIGVRRARFARLRQVAAIAIAVVIAGAGRGAHARAGSGLVEQRDAS